VDEVDGHGGCRGGVLQPVDDLERWWEQDDPWQYDVTPADQYRRAVLLSVLPKRPFAATLDIGCGNGFLTERLPGDQVLGVDVSANAIRHAVERGAGRVRYETCSLFDLPAKGWAGRFDLIVITGVLYPQYIAHAKHLVTAIVDELLQPRGVLVTCHIEEWYSCRFPYPTLLRDYYPYRDYAHVVEVYVK